MSICSVCLGTGATVYACGCRAALHAGCLVSLLEHKFRRCKVCLCSYNDAALHAAARYSLIHPPVLRRMLAFATSAINAGKPEEALSLLKTLPSESLPGGKVPVPLRTWSRACTVGQASAGRAELRPLVEDHTAAPTDESAASGSDPRGPGRRPD